MHAGGVWVCWHGVVLLALGCAGAAPSVDKPQPAEVATATDERGSQPSPQQLEALAKARDPRGIALAIQSLASRESSTRLLAARALVDYGAAARDARASLLMALQQEQPREVAGTMAWALIVLDAPSGIGVLLPRLRDGSMGLASHLDGSAAFDLGRLRQFGVSLKQDKDRYTEYLNALGDGVGGAALVAELGGVSPDPGVAFYERKKIFDAISRVNDPGAADALFAFTQRKPEPYFETRAAQALAMLGDLRAAPLLARRLRLDPIATYSDERDWEMGLKRDDNERVVSARLLADLATIHPQAHAELASAAEAALIFWLHDKPSPHANGLRALAAMGSRKDIVAFRGWANPQLPLPRDGEQPPMPEEWVIAQIAMRYVGVLRDAPSRPVLLKALQRRPPKLDATMDGLMQGGVAILGMTLRALGVGAADGLSEWGDASAFQPLLKYVEDSMNNEQSRLQACLAMGWVGTDGDLLALAQRLRAPAPTSKASQTFRACAVEALRQRPVPGLAPLLLPLLAPGTEVELRRDVARAIGRSALDAATEAQLSRLVGDPAVGGDATLALLLGGSVQAATAALRSYQRAPGASFNGLFEDWYRTFAFWSRDDVANGTLFRYVENASAMAALKLDQPTHMPLRMLSSQLEALVYDNGPHSVTRPVLISQLRQVATGPDDRTAQSAIRALALLREIGTLLHLSRTPGPRTAAARAAHAQALTLVGFSPCKCPRGDPLCSCL